MKQTHVLEFGDPKRNLPEEEMPLGKDNEDILMQSQFRGEIEKEGMANDSNYKTSTTSDPVLSLNAIVAKTISIPADVTKTPEEGGRLNILFQELCMKRKWAIKTMSMEQINIALNLVYCRGSLRRHHEEYFVASLFLDCIVLFEPLIVSQFSLG